MGGRPEGKREGLTVCLRPRHKEVRAAESLGALHETRETREVLLRVAGARERGKRGGKGAMRAEWEEDQLGKDEMKEKKETNKKGVGGFGCVDRVG